MRKTVAVPSRVLVVVIGWQLRDQVLGFEAVPQRQTRALHSGHECSVRVAARCVRAHSATGTAAAAQRRHSRGDGSLVEPYAGISLDVLLPADADIPAAVARARSEVQAVGFQIADKLPDQPAQPIATIDLANFSDLGWSGKKPGYVEAWTEGRDLQSVFSTVGIVRVQMRGPSQRAVDSLARLAKACHAVAAAYDAWIFDSYRAQLHRPESFADWMPDPDNVETFVRVVGVTSKTKPSHVRTMGFVRLGLPELYIPDVVPESDLDAARFLMLAAAQTYMQRKRVTRRGRFDVDMVTLNSEWNPTKDGTGKFEFEARWIRGPIRNKLIIELSLPGGSRDPSAFAAALHRFVVAEPEK